MSVCTHFLGLIFGFSSNLIKEITEFSIPFHTMDKKMLIANSLISFINLKILHVNYGHLLRQVVQLEEEPSVNGRLTGISSLAQESFGFIKES